jgi:hypothetical protein
MPAASAASALSSWRDLYVDAFLELNLNNVPQRIAEAERAIQLRLSTLRPGDTDEATAIEEAMRNLAMLYRNMAA